MTSKDLFLAILAMDAYNRGYDQGIKGLQEAGALGKAKIREPDRHEQID